MRVPSGEICASLTRSQSSQCSVVSSVAERVSWATSAALPAHATATAIIRRFMLSSLSFTKPRKRETTKLSILRGFRSFRALQPFEGRAPVRHPLQRLLKLLRGLGGTTQLQQDIAV